jgi:ABC-2 type transport system permease protein
VTTRRAAAIARHELRLLLRDPFPLVLLFVLPLVITAFLKPALSLALFVEGETRATGAEQAVPGMAVTFSLFLVGFVGLAFFRDHGWGTWDRIRVSARPGEILAGKLLPVLLVAWCQVAVLFLAGWIGFGLRVRGSAVGVAVVATVLPVASVAFGMAVVAVSSTLQQVNVVANIGTVVLAGLGGALIPLPLLPGWARSVAPASPAYWAMRGFRSVVLRPGGVGAVALPAVVLLAFAAACVAVAAVRFSFEDRKLSWS